MIKRQGFTLFEMLLVLFVVTSFVLLPTLAIGKWHSKLTQNFSFYRIEKSLLHFQQLAITQRTRSSVYLSEETQELIFMIANDPKAKKIVSLPEDIQLENDSYTIYFNSGTGNISISKSPGSFSNIIFKRLSTNEQIIYQFMLGSGRFERK